MQPSYWGILLFALFAVALIGWVVALIWSASAPPRMVPAARRRDDADQLIIIRQPDDSPLEAVDRAARMRAFYRRNRRRQV